MIKTVLHVFAVIIPAALLIFYIHTVAEMRAEAMASFVPEETEPEYEIDARTGLPIDSSTKLVMGEGYSAIKANCVKCHPTQIISSFRATRDGWLDAIRWMQKEKGLQDFTPETEEAILKYLSMYYGK